MPQVLPVDREKVKMVALQIGVREAARQFELSENTVMAWARREGWLTQAQEIRQVTEQHIEKRGMHAVARKTPSEVMISVGERSKLVLAKTVHKTAKQLHKAKDKELVLQTQALKATVDAGAKLHGWDTPSPSLTQINVNLAATELRDSPK